MPTDVKFDIGHVLFIDIVGYSKLLITDQSEQLEILRNVVRGTEQVRTAEADGKLLRLPTGDGGAVFRNHAEAPVLCAMEISKALREQPDLNVRMGIHSGPVNDVAALNDQANIAGAGVNIAQRVMDCGDAGHILLSKRVADDLSPYPKWNRFLHDLGEYEVKHGEKIALINFYDADIGNPEPPRKCQGAQLPPVAGSNTRDRGRKPLGWAVFGVLALLIAGAAIGVLLLRRPSSSIATHQSPAPISNGKSIAVLPFENLSRDPDNAYFADGIQEEILTRLSRISQLKVISRTSTQRYKSAPADLSEIGKQLGVAHVLEGTVQKSTDQVRVNVQLIDTRNDSHVWAEKYDRQLTDIFSVESEIANKIADSLKAKLTGGEQRAVASRPTENREAHDAYLKGRYFVAKRLGDNLPRAIEYFTQAVAQDPGYALAYAGLADSYVLLPEYSNVPAAECFAKARAAANHALTIDPDLSEAHTSMGIVLASAEMDFDSARRELERAIESDPNQAAAHYFLAIMVFAPLGQFDAAFSELNRALELDPLSVIINANFAYCQFLARHYSHAITAARRAIELDPTFPFSHRVLAQAFEKNGEVSKAIEEASKLLEMRRPVAQPSVLLAYFYGTHGDHTKAVEFTTWMKENKMTGASPAYVTALAFIGLGDYQQAIDWLERSYQDKEAGIIVYIKVDPMLDPLRGDPRFEKLANQVIPAKAK